LSEQVIIAIDPGEVVMGYTVGGFRGQQRRLIDFGDLKDVDAERAVRWLDALCCGRWPNVIAIEGFTFQGEKRSNNAGAQRAAAVTNALHGAALMWTRRANDSLTQVIMVSKNDANKTLGLTGACPKDRVKRAIDAVFPGNKLANQHQRDAALVLLAGKTRSGRAS
jgi:hypothetical protein